MAGVLWRIMLWGGLLAGAFFVFARVRHDYARLGNLSRGVATLQTGYFFGYALSSYAFLDSNLLRIQVQGIALILAFLLMAAGLIIVLASMPILGQRSFGQQVGKLHTGGIYRYTRNPQLVGSFLFLVGYSLLWPHWLGAIWVLLWLPISAWMVRAEEEHLRQVFGREYEAYCESVPRFFRLAR